MWLVFEGSLLCGHYSKAPYCVATIVWLVFEGSLLCGYYYVASIRRLLIVWLVFEGSLLCGYYSKAPYCVATIRRQCLIMVCMVYHFSHSCTLRNAKMIFSNT